MANQTTSNPQDSDTALLTEHFGYRPISLIDDIINIVNATAFGVIEAIERSLLTASPQQIGLRHKPDEETEEGRAVAERVKHEIENGVYQLETLLGKKIDHNFDKMEIFMLRNHLAIPAGVKGWIRMAHYEGLDFTPKTDAPTSESITMQRLRLRETQKLNAHLRSEVAQNEATLASLRALISPIPQVKLKKEPAESDIQSTYPTFKFLQDKGELTGDASNPISTATGFALTQLPALKLLLENLGPRLKALQEDGDRKAGFVGEAEKSWRRERSEFIETETKRHLEHVRGLELGEMGEVRDGEWQGEGRKLQKGEVEELERVVGMVGGSESGNGDGEPMDQAS